MGLEEFVVGGIPLLVFVFGLTQFFKEMLSLDGNKVRVASVIIGVVVMVLYQLSAILPEPYVTVYNVATAALVAGITAGGFYQYVEAKRQ